MYLFEVMGMKDDSVKDDSHLVEGLMDTILQIRQEAKANKDYATADKIRDKLGALKIQIKDTRDGATWEID